MKRPAWKLPYINSALMKSNSVTEDIVKTKILWFRNSQIPSYMIGRKVRVYNGAWYLVKTITADMVGTKFGQYSITKRFDTQVQSRMKSKKKLKNVKINDGSFNKC